MIDLRFRVSKNPKFEDYYKYTIEPNEPQINQYIPFTIEILLGEIKTPSSSLKSFFFSYYFSLKIMLILQKFIKSTQNRSIKVRFLRENQIVS